MKYRNIIFLIFCPLFIFQSNIAAQTKNDSISLSGDGMYAINSGNTKMIVDPKTGGRITSFKLGDYEFLVDKSEQRFSYGSTFWPSPQSMWNWPPLAVLDSKPYQVEDNGKSIKLTSGKDPKTGFQFVKEISETKNNLYNVKYSIINTTGEIKKAAPWEISRAHKGGLLFFPAGETPPHIKSFEMAPTETINGAVWYQDGKERPKNDQLTISDGSEGWLAYAIDGKLLIKKFKDLKPGMFAPGEDEICFYISHEANYIEIEIQGKYESIKPGEKTDWNVEWTAADIPANIKVEKGSKELVEFVRGIIK